MAALRNWGKRPGQTRRRPVKLHPPHRRSTRLAAWLASQGLLLLLCVALAGTATELLLARFASAAPDSTPLPQPPYPLQTAPPYTVALDAGHGGTDTGAQSLIDEVIVCDKTVAALYALLSSDPNFAPMLTRTPEQDPPIKDRAETTNKAQASLLISIHANLDGSRQSHGFECFPTPPGRLYSAESLHFAQNIVNGMASAGHRLRGETGIRFAYYNGKSKKIVDSTDTRVRSQKSFGIVEKVGCPAVLVEQCFITNYKDVETWASDEGCTKAARIYYEAICAYFGTAPLPQA